jgi:uncharacterized protein (TIGR03086 family)
MRRDRVGHLIEVGLDREAARLAVRDAVVTEEEGAVMSTGPLEQFDVLVPLFSTMLDDVDLDADTPCEGWAVRDLLGHVNGGARMFRAAFTGGPVHERSIDGDAAGVVREALAEFQDAVSVPGALDKQVDSPFGAMPGEQFARLAALDLLVHLWDLSRATKRPAAVPDEIVDEVAGFAHAAVTPELRGPQTFGPAVEAPAGASKLDQLAAFTGRRP